MARMHEDELELDEPLVRRLLAEQFPEWSELPLRRVEPSGTVNAIFRLGDELVLRLPRRAGPSEPGSNELDWLPKLAPLLPVVIPVPVAQGQRVMATRGTGRSIPGSRANRCPWSRSTRFRRRAISPLS